MYDNLTYANSAEMCKQMAAECDAAIIAFFIDRGRSVFDILRLLWYNLTEDL